LTSFDWPPWPTVGTLARLRFWSAWAWGERETVRKATGRMRVGRRIPICHIAKRVGCQSTKMNVERRCLQPQTAWHSHG